jgi:hypothetical protein
MIFRMGAVCAVCLAAFMTPASAEVSIEAVDTCLEQAFTAGTNPNECVDQTHQTCGTMPEDMHSAAALCFTKAREDWAAGIAAQMEALKAKADDKIMSIAGIEVKYDILSSLLQCDRMEELNRLSDQSGELILRQKAGCESTASGLAYVRLVWRSRSLK